MGDQQTVLSQEHTDAIHAFAEQYPLVLFSPITHTQVQALLKHGSEVLDELDAAFIEAPLVHSDALLKSYGHFWLWMLGAFEVIRTIGNKRGYFDAAFEDRVRVLRGRLAPIRSAMAKQQLAGQSAPITTEASVSDLDTLGRDMKFVVRSETISVRALVREFEEVITSVGAADVKKNISGAIRSLNLKA